MNVYERKEERGRRKEVLVLPSFLFPLFSFLRRHGRGHA